MKHISSILLISLIFSSLVAISYTNKVIAIESPYLNEDYNANYEWTNIPLVTPATVTLTVTSGGGGLDPNGVKTIYQTVGQYRTDFSDPRPSDPENSPITFSLVTPPSHGQLSPLPLQRMVVYTPTSGFTGSDSFTYVAKDSQGATSTPPATVTLTVTSGGGGLDPNGVKTIYQTVGQYRTDFSDPRPSDSMRWSVEDVPPNIEMTGYFKGGGSNTIDMKLHGGFHNRPDDREGACTYIITIPLEGGDTYLRTECPHPVYKDCTSRSGAAEADSLGNEQWRGYKAVIWNKANGGVHMEAWEDQGNNDGATPANQWVRLFSFDHDPGQTCGVFSEPLLQPRSPDSNETTFRIDDNSNTQAKWLSIVEIQPGGTASTLARTRGGTRYEDEV